MAISAGRVPALDAPVPIETGGEIMRARMTAARTRLGMGVLGIALIVDHPHLLPHPAFGIIGFAIIAACSIVQLTVPRLLWLTIEESLAGLAAVMLIGLESQHVSVLSILWLAAIASGVLARGGRVHWVGRAVVLVALVMPIARYQAVSVEYSALCIATLGLLLTSGRLTRELNVLLKQARLQADSAETLLLAGDIAARMADRGERGEGGEPAPAIAVRQAPRPAASAVDRSALRSLIGGEGLSMAVQPIVDVRNNSVHGYEALARFSRPGMEGSPLRWFSLAEEIGERSALERACLRAALELFARRPAGRSLSVNLSAPVLLEPLTMHMLEEAAGGRPDGLEGLIVEITEETLVNSDMELQGVIEPLRARGACLAVDDMGAGYSGLRQMTTVRPAYLKLDRSLISDIDNDGERAALVGALAGYARQVGSLLVAEGVETGAELKAVRRLGVPLVQGFYLARPGEPWPEISAVGTMPALPRSVRAARLPEVQSSDVLQRVS
jgi:EAL domain-containing protein (putative c-di-GMP-specific phosphodiesterase class I)